MEGSRSFFQCRFSEESIGKLKLQSGSTNRKSGLEDPRINGARRVNGLAMESPRRRGSPPPSQPLLPGTLLFVPLTSSSWVSTFLASLWPQGVALRQVPETSSKVYVLSHIVIYYTTFFFSFSQNFQVILLFTQ